MKKISLLDKYIGSKIKKKRVSLGLSQAKLGENFDVTFQQVQKYEAGSNRIPVSRLYILTKLFNVSFDYFFEGFEERFSNVKWIKQDEYLNKILQTKTNNDLINDLERMNRKFRKIKSKKDREVLLKIVDAFIKQKKDCHKDSL